MTFQDYTRRMRFLSFVYGGVIIFGTLIPGVCGALFLTTRLAASSTWERPAVFWAMFPTLIAPICIAMLLADLLDGRMGIKCSCGQSLSFGKHVRQLMTEGGDCPLCHCQAVEKKML